MRLLRNERQMKLVMLQFEQVKGMILLFHSYNTQFEARNILHKG